MQTIRHSVFGISVPALPNGARPTLATRTEAGLFLDQTAGIDEVSTFVTSLPSGAAAEINQRKWLRS